ncbi:uncharacterized protein LAESUDRAFT_713537 [Laetiporus sulphureus 93-53]|uniref:Uncharacterized protein n=1 Tax=Laetiporus sulphureus 93-53 TaxID=1314785 RepID=A0A165ENF6_9APHY|nr:uncharacterized protein LAESUDRAFT_713537 [Laetiporus sulphureus 93-53]KZT07428.1 hypothetical protein LAESUDRAFT_713537 [Laetiporus sulphureus 93-53]
MDRVRFGDQMDYKSQTSSEAFRAVADCLIQRHRNNVAINDLILTKCINLGEHAVAIFRELVPTVFWDGNVNSEDVKFGLPRPPSQSKTWASRIAFKVNIKIGVMITHPVLTNRIHLGEKRLERLVPRV